MKNGMLKRLMSLTLAIGLLLSVCGTSAFALEDSSEISDSVGTAYTDSGTGESSEETPPVNNPENTEPKDQLPADETEEELDIEALLPQFEGDREALIEEAQELSRQAKNEKEAYLSQFTAEELQEMEERTEGS